MKWHSFCNCIFLPKKGVKIWYIHVMVQSVILLLCNYSCLIWTLKSTKDVTYTVENVEGGIGQDPATEVTPFGLNRPPVCALHGVSWVWLAILYTDPILIVSWGLCSYACQFISQLFTCILQLVYPSTIVPSGRSSAALRAGGGTLGIDSSVTPQSSLE